jgi:hypothetical protein
VVFFSSDSAASPSGWTATSWGMPRSESFRRPLGLGVERDLYFKSTPLSGD